MARAQGWPGPGYAAVYDVVQSLDPAMVALAHEGSKRYKEVQGLRYLDPVLAAYVGDSVVIRYDPPGHGRDPRVRRGWVLVPGHLPGLP